MTGNDNNASVSDVTRRQATAEDMVEWLHYDGFYKGIVGWSDEWPPDEFIGPGPGPDAQNIVPEAFSATLLPTHPVKDDEWLDDMEAGLRDAAWDASHREYVKKILRSHSRLIPDAIKLIDRRLLDAGVTNEEVHTLTTGAATDAYKKLAKLDEVQQLPRVKRVQFRVVCELMTEGLSTVDLWLRKNCLLENFERSMDMHCSARGFRDHFGTCGTEPDLLKAGVEEERAPQVETVADRVWEYKLVSKETGEVHAISKNGWKALKSQGDFTEMMKILVKDDNLFAAVCPESTIKKQRNLQQKKVEMNAETAARENSPAYSDDDISVEIDWEAIGAQPIPEDFDWSRVENFRIVPESGGRPLN